MLAQFKDASVAIVLTHNPGLTGYIPPGWIHLAEQRLVSEQGCYCLCFLERILHGLAINVQKQGAAV